MMPIIIIVFATFTYVATGKLRNYVVSITLFFSSASVFYMFYLNRNEVYTLILEGEMLHLDFLNKSFFKRKPLELHRAAVQSKVTDAVIELMYEGKHIATLRKVSMTSEEWESVAQFLL